MATPDELRTARLANALATERVRAHRLSVAERRAARRELRESLSPDWVSPYLDMLGIAGRTGDPVVGGPTGYWQRRHGANWPIFRTEQELSLLRAPARALCATNSYAQGMLRGLSAYVVSTGCTYRMAARQKEIPVPKALIAAAQRIVDETLRRNQWHGGEQPAIEPELFERSLEDGEFILTHYKREDGWTDFRTQEPEQLTQPPSSDVREYGFGVLTPPEDVQSVRKYYLQFGDSPSQGEEYEPDEVTHFRRNVRRSMKRGLTDFCFDAFDAISLAGKLRTNLGRCAAIQAAKIGVRQHDNGTQEEVQAFVEGDSDWTETDQLTGTQNRVKLGGGVEWEDVPKGLNYVPGPGANNAPAHLSVLQACLRGAVVKWNGFEWLISADASNNNYASSLTAESPFVRRVLQEQRGYREAFRKPILFALKHYIQTHGLRVPQEDGTIRVYQWEEVEALVDLLVEAPSPETRNKLEDANRASIEIPLGVQSRQGYAQEQGRDYDQIEADNSRWDDEHGSAGGQLPDQAPPLTESLLESGFTGIDSNGHHWQNGKQVKAQPDAGAPAPASSASQTASKPPSTGELENSKIGKTLHSNVQIRHTAGGDWVVKGRNGKRAQVENEAAASALAGIAGVNVPQVHRVTMYGQDQAAVQVVKGTDLTKMSTDERRAALAKVPKADIDKQALFDYVIGSGDPNNGNYMIGEKGDLVGLDKEQSLGLSHIGNKATVVTPFFLQDAPGGESGYQYDSEHVGQMAAAGEKMAASLKASGRTKDAVGVERRAAVLKQVAATGKPVSTQQLAAAGEAYDKSNPPPRGFFGRLFGG